MFRLLLIICIGLCRFFCFILAASLWAHVSWFMVNKSQSSIVHTMHIDCYINNLMAFCCVQLWFPWMIIIFIHNGQPQSLQQQQQQQHIDSFPKCICKRLKKNDNREFVCGYNTINSVKLFKRLLAFILFLLWSCACSSHVFFSPFRVRSRTSRMWRKKNETKRKKQIQCTNNKHQPKQNKLTNDAGPKRKMKKKK